MRMGSSLQMQLSTDIGEETGGRKGKQRKAIKSFFPMLLPYFIYYVSVCWVQSSVKDPIHVSTPAFHAALPSSLTERII